MAAKQDLSTKAADILVVDDSIASLRMLTEILTTEGYRSRPIEQPQSALKAALAQPPDLILLDVRMPKMSGFEVCRRLKQDERTRDVPVIFVSALQDTEDRVQGFEVGGVDYISKPIQEAEVLARVKTHLQLRETQSHLESLVSKRTADLAQTNRALKAEIAERKRAEERLRENERKLAGIIDSISDHMSMVDRDLNVVWANEAAKQMFGPDMIGKKCHACYHQSDVPCSSCLVLKTLEDGQVHELVTEVLDRDGNTRIFLCTANVSAWDEEQKPSQVVEISRDITESKRAENELRESEERFRATFEQAAVGIDHEAPDGRFLRINQKFCDIVGYSQEEMLERAFQDITHPDDLDIDLEDAQRMLDGQLESYSNEKRYLRNNGEIVWVNVTVSLVRDETGGPGYFISVVEDITERKQAEEALEESEEKFRTLVTNTEEIVYMIAKDGTFLLSEGKGLSKLGLNPGEVVGHSVFELYREYPQMLDDMRRALAGETVTTEVNVDGNHFRNWYTPHMNHEGEIIGLLGLSVNITERRRAEEVLKADLAYHREDLSVLVQRHSLAVKISSLGIWDWDLEENSMTWDNKLFEIYGIEKRIPMPYEDWVHLIHPDDLPTVEAIVRTVIETKSEGFLDFRIVRPDGELRHINAAGTVVLNDAGEVVKAIGMNQDITERKLLEAQLEQAAARAERDRLAQDLHDSVTQGLYSAGLIAEALPSIWEQDPEEGRRGLKQLERLTQGASAEMRALLLELRPAALLDQELPVLLRQLANATMARTRTVVTTTVVGDCATPDEVKIALYRITQEALNNVVKHAQARQARINLHDDGAKITVRVSDNGVGCNPEVLQSPGAGLGIMRERADNVDATLTITSRPAQGTEVLAEWSAS
jgi:PAS domain S-box-containing protein